MEQFFAQNSEIILRLIRGEIHLRELSKEIGIPSSTLSRKLYSLRQKLVIDYKSEGKNNVYFISTHFLKEGCKYFLKNRGEEYKDILSNKTIKVNDNELIVREKGLFCLNKRIGSKK